MTSEWPSPIASLGLPQSVPCVQLDVVQPPPDEGPDRDRERVSSGSFPRADAATHKRPSDGVVRRPEGPRRGTRGGGECIAETVGRSTEWVLRGAKDLP